MAKKAIIGGLIGTAAAAALFASPALSASVAADRAESLSSLYGQFTPATGDPRLIERYAKVSEEAKREFRFTPVVARSADGSRAITVVVRSPAGTLRPTQSIIADSLLPEHKAKPLAIAPVAYDLGKSVGFTKFAMPTSDTKVDLAAIPQVAKPQNTTQGKSRFSTELRVGKDGAIDRSPRTLNPDDSVSVDLNTGYDVSRRLKVTAGVRIKQENDRLSPLADDRRDSQAVYVGTRFKF